MAWMSDSTTSPNSRFTPNPNGYKLLNGTLIATDYDDLTDSTLLAAIDLTETGVGPTRPVVWTGTLANGDYAGASCADWTDSSAGLVKAGNPTSVDLKWTSAGRFSCTTKLPIYCFEQ